MGGGLERHMARALEVESGGLLREEEGRASSFVAEQPDETARGNVSLLRNDNTTHYN